MCLQPGPSPGCWETQVEEHSSTGERASEPDSAIHSSFEAAHRPGGAGSCRGRSCAQAGAERSHSGMMQMERETIGGSTARPDHHSATRGLFIASTSPLWSLSPVNKDLKVSDGELPLGTFYS
ncbi:unnamed protein product [Pleuronectes platessa]|uniref:Uncharacterized protein n=1 Tax=Pleuronectes platessa TaxID=8262 RepID=A0A9N7VEN7_PLEPL|nr:unnamed protein product [Pleuronectes platessa]